MVKIPVRRPFELQKKIESIGVNTVVPKKKKISGKRQNFRAQE